MKSLLVKVSMAAFTLAGVFAATPALAGHVLDFQVLGKGSVLSDCSPLFPATGFCRIILSGQASGTHIGHDDFELNLLVTSASHSESNGAGGLCVVATGTLTLTPPGPSADPPIITFNVAGNVCEEGALGSDAGFNLHYRITGGENRFAGRSGAGSLTGGYDRPATPTGAAYLHLHGTIDR